MSKLFGALLLLLITVAAALWLHDQGGYVIIRLGEWTIETSVLLFTGAVLASAVLVYIGVHVVRRLLGLPTGVRHWWGSRKRDRARNQLIEGLIRTAEGRDTEAEKLLLRNLGRSDIPILHYLVAAIAAHAQGAADRRDRYLAAAEQGGRRARLAVGLLQAQLQMDSGQWEQAFASVSYLQDRFPHNRRVLRMMMRCCIELKEWERLAQLLPTLHRQQVVGENELNTLERDVAQHRLERATRESGTEVSRVWAEVPKALRDDKHVLTLYARGLALHQRSEEAERVVRTRLQKQWSETLLRAYTALELDPAQQLTQLERWLRERPEDPVLLYHVGRQCIRNQLWGRARSYLEAALAREPTAEAHQALGTVLDHLNESALAREHYRRGLELATGNSARQASARLVQVEKEEHPPLPRPLSRKGRGE